MNEYSKLILIQFNYELHNQTNVTDTALTAGDG